MKKLMGLSLVLSGAALIATGLRERDSLLGKLGELVSGQPSEEVLAYLIGGAWCVLLGLVGLKGERPQK